MRRPNFRVCTVILLALPVFRCAIGQDLEPSKSVGGGSSKGGSSNAGGFSSGSGGTLLPGSGGAQFVSGGAAMGGNASGAGVGGGLARGGSSGQFAGSGNAGSSTGGSSGASGNGGAAGAALGGSAGAAGKGSAGASGCSNGLKDGSETDKDCGGACGACDPTLACQADADCTSKQCVSLKCALNTCGDGMQSGNETDADCGGSCKPCAVGLGCSVAADCQGKNCSAGKCGTPNHCAYAWRDSSACAMSCLGRPQGDQLKCKEVLDCYVEQDCGPATCAGNDQKCGANKLGFGTAPYPHAQQVYDCLCKS